MSQTIIQAATEFSRDFEVDHQINTPEARANLLGKTIHFLQEELGETEQAIATQDLAEVVDGFGDVAFVALNGIYKQFRLLGHSHETATQYVEEVMRRICTANLAKKQADGTVLRVNGKVQKPQGWQPPQYEDILPNKNAA